MQSDGDSETETWTQTQTQTIDAYDAQNQAQTSQCGLDTQYLGNAYDNLGAVRHDGNKAMTSDLVTNPVPSNLPALPQTFSF